MIKVTKEYIKEVFDECNEKYFDNQLKNCKFSVFETTRARGSCYFKKQNGKLHGRIWIAKNVLWTEATFRELVIHEMIHLYNGQIENSFVPLFGHSWKFRRKLREFNQKYKIEYDHMPSRHIPY